jgi:hypothetical protein
MDDFAAFVLVGEAPGAGAGCIGLSAESTVDFGWRVRIASRQEHQTVQSVRNNSA